MLHMSGNITFTFSYALKLQHFSEPSSTVGRNANWCSHSGRRCGGSSKNYEITMSSSNSISQYLLEENKNTNSKRYMHTYCHCSTI